MSDRPIKKRRIRKVETVRERVQKANSAVKPKRIRNTASKAARPLKTLRIGLIAALRPLGWTLRPLKTRPFRFFGRILAKILFLGYVRDSWKEVRQVTWPSRKETVKLTLAVFVFAFMFGLTVAITDYGLDRIFKKILLQ